MANKHYVVWSGTKPGIYDTWDECRQQVHGVAGATYKAYGTRQEAEAAYAQGCPYKKSPSASNATDTDDATSCAPTATPCAPSTKKADKTKAPRPTKDFPPNPPTDRHDTVLPLPPAVTANALAVDAACSGNPGPMEYRGVDLATGETVFHYGPVHGTNNIGEFLAIVHALALLKQKGLTKTVYSDSRNALLWVKQRKCKTTLKRTPRTENLFQLIERAENWLKANDWSHIPLLKWETSRWGEVPADFGRK